MPMLIRFTIKSAAWLAVALVSVACAATMNPTGESSLPAEPTPGDLTGSDNQLSDTPPTMTEEAVAPPTAAKEDPTVPPSSPTSPALLLPDLGPAPDITNEVWLNTDQPLNLAALRGRVVVVEFWTFG